MDGLLFSNHTPTPGLTEYRKAIEPVQVPEDSTPDKILIINRYDFLTLDHLKCTWRIISDGHKTSPKETSIPKGVKPGTKAALFILGEIRPTPAGEFLEVSFALKERTLWADAGFEVAWGQIPFKKDPKVSVMPPVGSASCPKVTRVSPEILEVTGRHKVWQFDTVHGCLSGCKTSSGTPVFQERLKMDFYRAVTDNEGGNDGWEWRVNNLHLTKPHLQSFEATKDPATSTVTIVALHRIAPPVFEWSVDTITTYEITDSGLKYHVKGNPRGLRLPRTFARIGLTLRFMPTYSQCSWYGRGPGEAYFDSKLSQRIGNYSSSIDALFTNYEWPQEGSNRTDIRWVSFSDEDDVGKITAKFGDQQGCSFMASHYTTEDLDECGHIYELEKRKKQEVIVRLDWKHQGLGSGSCGPKVLPEYELRSEPFEFELVLE
jgi:beta-galactosidase